MSEQTPVDAPQRLDGSREEFVADLRTAIAAWKVAPWLPVVGTVVWAGGGFGTLWPGGGGGGDTATRMWAGTALLLGLAGMALAVYSLGWAGSERETYRQIWKGRRVSLGDSLSGAFAYVGRFFVLGLLCYLPVIAVMIVVLAMLDVEPARALPLGAILAVSTQILLTFVTPALVFDEERATRALGAGLRLLRAQGRRAAWYALVPTAIAIPSFALSQLWWPVAFITAIAYALAHVALRGAIVAAYLRLTRPPVPAEAPTSSE